MSRLTATIAVAAALLAIATSERVAADSIKFKAQHVNVATRFDTLMIADEPGHMIAFFTAKGVGKHIEGPEKHPYKIDVWGSGDYRGDGTGEEQGTPNSPSPMAPASTNAGPARSAKDATSVLPSITAVAVGSRA